MTVPVTAMQSMPPTSVSKNPTADPVKSGGGFWKKSSSAVPGRPNPSKLPEPASVPVPVQPKPILTRSLSSSGSKPGEEAMTNASTSSFRVFEQSVSDAWDIRDTDPAAPSAEAAARPAGDFSKARVSKQARVEALVSSPSIELEDLRNLAWPGLPTESRAKAWKILCGYLPGNAARQAEVLQRKQEEYQRYVDQYFVTKDDDVHQDTYRQISIDIPRMSPVIGLFQQRTVQEIFERILFIWALRHPASGYVQGINDLVTPFFLVFLRDALVREKPDELTSDSSIVPSDVDVSALSAELRNSVEADSFWCLTVVLDGIQDNYTFAQPGIQTKLHQLEDLVRRIDVKLHEHLVKNDVVYLQFAFRWMNNLLMRELPVRASVRLWDTYLSQANGFSHFHLYVCAAFLVNWKSELLKRNDFHTILMFLQNLPTAKWGDEEINLLVAEAYRLSYLFAGAPSHLASSRNAPKLNAQGRICQS